MKKTFTKISLFCSLFMFAGVVNAQTMTDTTAEFKPSGKLWGYAFGDYAYKGGTDEANRGGSNQYTKIPVNSNMFQWRRIYLGYNYEISKKFSAEFLLASEDDFASGVLGQGNGDILVNNKFSPYVKIANIRWKNFFRNSDLVFGQMNTPGFAKTGRNDQTSEEVWAYRSIERTISDIRRTPSFDFGAALQGWFDNGGKYGYDLMVANGQSAKPENDAFKWFYGDVWAKFFDKRLVIQFYQDYEKLNWNAVTTGQAQIPTSVTTGTVTTTTYANPSPAGLHHDREMSKIFVAWNTKKLTVGAEVFEQVMLGDVQEVVKSEHKVYYATTKAMGISAFVRGRIYKEKLGFFARYDNYDPTGNLNNVVNNPLVTSYSALTSQYEPSNKEQFVTLGIDYTPIKNVHIMPNIWLNTYNSGVDATASNSAGTKYSSMNSNISPIKGTDAVYRLTFYWIYGK